MKNLAWNNIRAYTLYLKDTDPINSNRNFGFKFDEINERCMILMGQIENIPQIVESKAKLNKLADKLIDLLLDEEYKNDSLISKELKGGTLSKNMILIYTVFDVEAEYLGMIGNPQLGDLLDYLDELKHANDAELKRELQHKILEKKAHIYDGLTEMAEIAVEGKKLAEDIKSVLKENGLLIEVVSILNKLNYDKLELLEDASSSGFNTLHDCAQGLTDIHTGKNARYLSISQVSWCLDCGVAYDVLSDAISEFKISLDRFVGKTIDQAEMEEKLKDSNGIQYKIVDDDYLDRVAAEGSFKQWPLCLSY